MWSQGLNRKSEKKNQPHLFLPAITHSFLVSHLLTYHPKEYPYFGNNQNFSA